MQIANFGRSPGDKKEASQMTSMWNDLVNTIKRATPWVEEEKKKRIRERLKKPPKSKVVETDGDIPEEVRRVFGLS